MWIATRPYPCRHWLRIGPSRKGADTVFDKGTNIRNRRCAGITRLRKDWLSVSVAVSPRRGHTYPAGGKLCRFRVLLFGVHTFVARGKLLLPVGGAACSQARRVDRIFVSRVCALLANLRNYLQELPCRTPRCAFEHVYWQRCDRGLGQTFWP